MKMMNEFNKFDDHRAVFPLVRENYKMEISSESPQNITQKVQK